MPLYLFFCRSFVALLFLLLAVGCGGDKLTGKVTVDGMEVNAGILRFNPDLNAGVDGPMVYADVKDGVYHLLDGSKTTAGKNIVSLTVATKWLKSKGQDTSPEDGVAFTDLVQTVDVTSEGSFDLDFDTK